MGAEHESVRTNAPLQNKQKWARLRAIAGASSVALTAVAAEHSVNELAYYPTAAAIAAGFVAVTAHTVLEELYS